MTYFEAALQVLRSSRTPLTTREITDRAVKQGLIVPRGKTPEATMGSVLYGRLATDPYLIKLEDRGETRAKKGTVRWVLRNAQVPT